MNNSRVLLTSGLLLDRCTYTMQQTHILWVINLGVRSQKALNRADLRGCTTQQGQLAGLGSSNLVPAEAPWASSLIHRQETIQTQKA